MCALHGLRAKLWGRGVKMVIFPLYLMKRLAGGPVGTRPISAALYNFKAVRWLMLKQDGADPRSSV